MSNAVEVLQQRHPISNSMPRIVMYRILRGSYSRKLSLLGERWPDIPVQVVVDIFVGQLGNDQVGYISVSLVVL